MPEWWEEKNWVTLRFKNREEFDRAAEAIASTLLDLSMLRIVGRKGHLSVMREDFSRARKVLLKCRILFNILEVTSC